ncbi:MAG: CBS domain-containing protein [Phycisphaerae bacterium]
MTLVRDILERKDRKVVAVSPRDSVLDAARRMNEERIGAVVVCEPGQGVVGIFTERDILRRVVAERKSPEHTLVGEVMSRPVTCCRKSTPVRECQSVMTSKRLRHLPVVEDDELVGMLSIGDLMALEVEMQQSTIDYLTEYLHGRT